MIEDQVVTSDANELVLGNEAIALGLLDGGIGYVASYPGTPSTEIMESVLANPQRKAHANWSTNEAVAMEEAIAASITGVDAATICKSVGLNVAMDALMTISNSGVYGALVIVVADDPGMHSSQNEQDTRVVAAKFAGIPVFEPSTAQEAYYYTRQAILFSREYQVPVLVRSVTRLSHSLSALQREPPRPIDNLEYIPNIRKHVSIPGNARKNHHEMLKIHDLLQDVADEKAYWKEIMTTEYPEYLVITSGNSANYAIEAIKSLDIGVHIFIPKLIHPLPREKLTSLLEEYSYILVIEELEPYLEDQIRILLSQTGIKAHVEGKGVLTTREGELTIEKIRSVLIDLLHLEDDHATIDLPVYDDLLRVRPPVLCAGCPHRSTYVELGEALKRFDPIFHNDIGCYSLGVMPPHKSADMLICMGASIPMATASSVTQPDRLAVAVIGDSTFWHTGLSGLANAIWKDANILVMIADNSYTAMTGGQPNPTSHNDKMSLVKTVEGMGARVWEIDPMNYKESRNTIKEAALESGVRVIISSHPCALRKDTQDKEQMATTMVVDEDLCTGCSLCVTKLGCPAISMDGDLAKIDPAQCNSCGYCEQICRFDAIRRVD